MSRFKGIYWRTFTVTVGMVALTLVLLGASFFALTYSYIMSEKRGELEDKAEVIAQMAVGVYNKRDVFHLISGMRSDIEELVDVAKRMSDTEFLVWMPSMDLFISTDASVSNTEMVVPGDIVARLERGETYAGTTDLGVYDKARFVVAVPARSTQDGVLVGPVLAIAEPNAMTEMWGAFMGIFGMTSITVLLIAFVASATTAMQQTKPIRDMAAAARRFADGNFDARVHNTGRDDETGELIDAFNAMADSLQKTEQQRREFIANISHELKTPMTTIAGFADGILDGTIPKEKAPEALATISSETRRLSRLVRRMLDLSRLQSSENVLAQERFDISEVLLRVLVSLEGKITSRGLDVETHLPDGPVMVWGNPDAITQVCYNLLDNAIKFAAADSVLSLTIQIKGEKVHVSIANLGETIPPEELGQIFDRFHKTDRSRSVDREGVGLGLYIVKTIINNHREAITVTSEDGLTTFTFTLTVA